MGVGSRAWRALMRRNLIYRRTHYIASASEWLLPIAFLGIVVSLKNAADIGNDDVVSTVKSIGFYENIASFVALLVALGFLYPAASMIRYIVAEKEQRMKELMKIMSCRESDIGWSWFLSFFGFHLVTAIVCSFISKRLYSNAAIFLLLIFWVFALTTFIVLAMLVASVFSKTTPATFVGLLVFFFGYFLTLAEDFKDGDPVKLHLISLHPMATFSYAFREIGRLEDKGVGLTLETMHTTNYASGYTFAKVLRYLFFDSIIYGISVWYLNRATPPSYGQGLPFYFPFTFSYWYPARLRKDVDVTNAEAPDDTTVPIEAVSEILRMQAREGKSIEIHHLRKAFGDKVALDDLNLSFYNGQITALLGENGAGKTTTINILTGALSSSDGTAIVGGKDIRTSMQQIREDMGMGVVLQQDCIFPNLTVRQHIQFFSRVKGLYARMSKNEAEEKITQSLRDVALFDKSETLAKNLSGGMKRKLSVAMAFCGESKVVVLDEPTSGMDPWSRRFTWNLIRQYRKDRIIILTTHHMDEADILGDRIAILAKGRLRCCGSALYLKNKYGVGYQLTLEKRKVPSQNDHQDVSEDVETTHVTRKGPHESSKVLDEFLTDTVKGHVREASLLSNVATELKFQLPMNASAAFVPMLQRLDTEIAEGTIASYGMGFTTLDEVFILVSRGEDAGVGEEEAKQKATENSRAAGISLHGSANLSRKDYQRDDLFLTHIQALFLKRWANFKRDKKAWVFTTILPSLFVLLGFLLFGSMDVIALWFLIVLSFPFISGAFGTFVVAEKQAKSKHLQTICGVTPTEYWLSTFMWDVLNYQFTLWITIILMFAFNVEELTTAKNDVLSGVIILLIGYGPAAASFTYCTSFLFSSPAFCSVLNIVFGFLIGFGGTIVGYLLWFFGNGWNKTSGDDDVGSLLDPKRNLLTAAKALSWVLRIFMPSFNLANGLFYAINLSGGNQFIKGGTVTTVWNEEIMLYEVIFLFLQGFLYLLLAIQIDRINNNPDMMMGWRKLVRLVTARHFFKSEINVIYTTAEDEDVAKEQERVSSGEANRDLIVIDKLSKMYANGKLAVSNLSLGIPNGECFGLLGTNGAGKTTTMGMLTTELIPTSGDAKLAGFSIRNEAQQTRSRIGYCPQFDAHFTNMTGREHVELYASIKGTPREYVKELAAAKLAAVGLSEDDSDRLSVHYSGGMKRRLSLACATIGQPELIFLDEPSTGVDPVGRREIWMMISELIARNTTVPHEDTPSVILTTHSMEECEALCSRIGIMAHGKLRCLGSAQHLKTRFGRGYQLEMKIQTVEKTAQDFVNNLLAIGCRKAGFNHEHILSTSDRIFFDHPEAISALQALSTDNYLSNLVTPNDPVGCIVYKDASSAFGVTLDTLAYFATTQLRMRNVHNFVTHFYPYAALREWQDLKARYEISSGGLNMASIFANVERNKMSLMLENYGVSQSTLEDVFNMHAAEAENMKTSVAY